MSTQMTVTQHYAATPEKVFALFGNPVFLAARLAASGGIDPEIVSQTSDNETVELVTRQGIPAAVLPSIIGSFISGDPSTQRTESWKANDAGGYDANFKVTIQGAPASLKGTMSLAASGEGSVLHIDAEAIVPVPMFGPKIEKVIVEQVSELLAREEMFTQGQLAQ
ncbi:DUF2505 domain-containing protein [Nakamurella antarctica]|uniref:DUF2505 domain-containing protein n=1 Tax=Nakamurella antarctica TaxID=1902245 RepID=A0A3G8ZQE8_9ACTN|nr:DUF2505 domain-containing protein [Nakamurella antarctica]AZI59027.1 DUF2505 domain-containing protein [Nakamurella antarctica]